MFCYKTNQETPLNSNGDSLCLHVRFRAGGAEGSKPETQSQAVVNDHQVAQVVHEVARAALDKAVVIV